MSISSEVSSKLRMISWDMTQERRGFQENWFIFRDYLVQAQDRTVLISRKPKAVGGQVDEQEAPN